MKICPSCQNTYSDDGLQFCLQDGTALQNFTAQPQAQSWTDSETLVLPNQTAPQQPGRVQVDIPQQQSQSWGQSQQQASMPTFQAEPQKSNTMKIVALTALGMFLLFGVGGIGAWLMLRNMGGEVVANTNTKPSNANSGINANTGNLNANANTSNSNTNANTNSNANVNANAATPKPTLKPAEAQEVRDDVNAVIDDWKDASEDLDLDSHMSNYADTVDYYKAGKVSKSKVAADKQRAYDKYSSIVVTISNVKVTPSGTGDEATAVFDKEWSFAGDEDFSSGKVQQQLQLKKINGKWKIAGEKDLKVYFVEK